MKRSTLRPFILAVIILSLLAYGLPVGESLAARFVRRPSVSRSKKRHFHRRRSRAWWRRRRAYLRRKRARALAMRRRREMAADPKTPGLAPRVRQASVGANAGNTPAGLARKSSRSNAAANFAAPAARSPYDLVVPASWSGAGASATGEVKFNVRTLEGAPAGVASLSPVSAPRADALSLAPRAKTLGGVPLNALRRTVIDLMVAEGGWVINDMERQIADRRVYVVIAQTGSPAGPQKRWMFYFTEVDGRIYRLASATPLELSEPVIAASERLIATFRVGVAGSGGPTLASKAPR